MCSPLTPEVARAKRRCTSSTKPSTEAPTGLSLYIFAYDCGGALLAITAARSDWARRGAGADMGRAAVEPLRTDSHTSPWLWLTAACSRTLGCTMVLAALNCEPA